MPTSNDTPVRMNDNLDLLSRLQPHGVISYAWHPEGIALNDGGSVIWHGSFITLDFADGYELRVPLHTGKYYSVNDAVQDITAAILEARHLPFDNASGGASWRRAYLDRDDAT